ncbi:MAG: phosphoribosyl-ATP diphosphatase [Rhizobiales bacterium]|nr:phosphoribosyl-ATP diphosphatase [Hyphomicrobiales bacterium]NRB15214.1 phosphoribosyl-ATP diphosphatase [Hyphomicrobiales bacterium]
MHTLDMLNQTISTRANESADTSYTASLLAKGTQKCAQKLGEEAVELVIGAVANNHDEIVSESADLLYHWLVLLKSCGISPDEVYQKLAERQNISGLVEKASRK